MVKIAIKHNDIMSVMKLNPNLNDEQKKESVLCWVLEKFALPDNEKVRSVIKERLRNSFYNNFKRRWNKLPKNSRSYAEFEAKHAHWLQQNSCINFDEKKESPAKGK